MRITHEDRTYELLPDDLCWEVCEITISPKHGTEIKSGRQYPGRFDQALQLLMDRMLRDGLGVTAELNEAVATVAHLHRVIMDSVADEGWLRRRGGPR